MAARPTLNKLCITSLFLCIACKVITAQAQEPVFAGSTSCRIPNSTYCGVNYPVPDVVATLASLIEEELSMMLEVDEDLTRSCFQTMKEILCAQKFPKCVDNNVILTSTENCKQKLLSNCSAQNSVNTPQGAATFCSLEATVPLGTCSTLGTFTASFPFSYDYCSGVLDENLLITEWMFWVIQHTDRIMSLSVHETSALNILGPHCTNGYSKYFCQYFGKCIQDSSAIVLINDYHTCEATLNCYDDFTADYLRPLFPCGRFRNLNNPVRPTEPTPVPSGPTPAPLTDGRPWTHRGGDVISIIPSARTYPFLSGSQTIHAHLMVCVTALLLSVLLNLL